MALTYLLDTNTVSYLLRNQPPAVRKHMDRAALAATCISTITEAELCYGLASKPGAIRQRIAIDAFLSVLQSWRGIRGPRGLMGCSVPSRIGRAVRSLQRI